MSRKLLLWTRKGKNFRMSLYWAGYQPIIRGWWYPFRAHGQ